MDKGLKKLDTEVCHAIVSCISIGSGRVSGLVVNGKQIDDFEWTTHCILDPLYGGVFCDGKLVCKIAPGEPWYVDEMYNNDIVYNHIDQTRLEDPECSKKRLRDANQVVVEDL